MTRIEKIEKLNFAKSEHIKHCDTCSNAENAEKPNLMCNEGYKLHIQIQTLEKMEIK